MSEHKGNDAIIILGTLVVLGITVLDHVGKIRDLRSAVGAMQFNAEHDRNVMLTELGLRRGPRSGSTRVSPVVESANGSIPSFLDDVVPAAPTRRVKTAKPKTAAAR